MDQANEEMDVVDEGVEVVTTEEVPKQNTTTPTKPASSVNPTDTETKVEVVPEFPVFSSACIDLEEETIETNALGPRCRSPSIENSVAVRSPVLSALGQLLKDDQREQHRAESEKKQGSQDSNIADEEMECAAFTVITQHGDGKRKRKKKKTAKTTSKENGSQLAKTNDRCKKNLQVKWIQTSKKSWGKRSKKSHRALAYSSDRPYKCSTCYKGYRTATDLAIHEKNHNPEKPWKCNICTSQFNFQSALKKHMITHLENKPFACHLCSYTANKEWTMKVHLTTHEGQNPFTCPLCDFATNQYSLLRSHQELHAGEKPFECNKCGQRFGMNGRLKIHLQKRHGVQTNSMDAIIADLIGTPSPVQVIQPQKKEKRARKRKIMEHGDGEFECAMCLATFMFKSHLKTHLKKCPLRPCKDDGKTESFECKACLSFFSSRGRLKRHMATCKARRFSDEMTEDPVKASLRHSNQLECFDCSMKFTSEKSLLRHTNMYGHECMPRIEDGLVCPYCKLTFPSVVMLRRHQDICAGVGSKIGTMQTPTSWKPLETAAKVSPQISAMKANPGTPVLLKDAFPYFGTPKTPNFNERPHTFTVTAETHNPPPHLDTPDNTGSGNTTPRSTTASPNTHAEKWMSVLPSSVKYYLAMGLRGQELVQHILQWSKTTGQLTKELDSFNNESLLNEICSRRGISICICGTIFTSRKTFRAHNRMHKEAFHMMCAECDYLAFNSFDFWDHLIDHNK